MMVKNKGFSLIELMIVVGIIGILILTAMPMYNHYVTRVKITEIKNMAINIGSQINTAYISGNMEAHDYTVDQLQKKSTEYIYDAFDRTLF